MKRTTVRLAAAVLAAGISVSELAAIAALADYLSPQADAVVTLPRVVINSDAERTNATAGTPGETLARRAPLPPL